jgi:Flp pilus assembly protein TadD
MPQPRDLAQSTPSLADSIAKSNPKLDAAVARASVDAMTPTGGSVELHLDLGRALDAQGQLERANDEYHKAINAARSRNLTQGTKAGRARLQRRLAAAYDRLGRFREANAHYHEAQKLAPNDPDVWNDCGYSAYLQGRWDDAEKHLRKALSLDRGHERATTNLGLTLAASGRVDEAFELLRGAGGASAAHANIAYVLAAQGKHDEARSHYELAKKLQPNLQVAVKGVAALDDAVRLTSASPENANPVH